MKLYCGRREYSKLLDTKFKLFSIIVMGKMSDGTF
jgi:hypothetical protein